MLNVIVVDDRPAVCEGLKKMIPWDAIGAAIVGQAGDGLEALKLALELQPDVIITDVRMPQMDGLELARRVSEALPETEIVILSAYDEFSYAQNALRYGVTEYILKPIDRKKIQQITDIIARISNKMSKRRDVYTLVYDPAIEQKVSLLLKTTQEDGLNEFFEFGFPDLEETPFQAVKELCVKLLALFFDTLSGMNVAPDNVLVDKEAAWSELLGCKTKPALKAFVKSLYVDSARMLEGRKNSHTDAIVEHLKTYIEKKYADPGLSVYTMASDNGLSANYTSVIFRQVTGTNISVYITNLRMNKAKELLGVPAHSINDVAGMAGYADPHYFAKAFKKSEGVTPSQYRNLTLGQERP